MEGAADDDFAVRLERRRQDRIEAGVAAAVRIEASQ